MIFQYKINKETFTKEVDICSDFFVSQDKGPFKYPFLSLIGYSSTNKFLGEFYIFIYFLNLEIAKIQYLSVS